MHTRAAVVSCLALTLCFAACKGKTEYKDSEATLAKVDNLANQVAAKDKLIKDYELRVASLERNGGTDAAQPGELLVTFVDDVLTISPAGGGSRPVNAAASEAMSKAFIDVVQKSRGAIQKCYEAALKKNSALQSKTVRLKISATFAASGAFQRTSFSPALDSTFDSCLRAVASKWVLPGGSENSVTFQAPVSLTPN